MTYIITALKAPCPLCGFVQTFTAPAQLRSMICDGCNNYVCESEWHAAFMAQVEAAFGRPQEAVPL